MLFHRKQTKEEEYKSQIRGYLQDRGIEIIPSDGKQKKEKKLK
jgi:hypothetical protein